MSDRLKGKVELVTGTGDGIAVQFVKPSPQFPTTIKNENYMTHCRLRFVGGAFCNIHGETKTSSVVSLLARSSKVWAHSADGIQARRAGGWYDDNRH